MRNILLVCLIIFPLHKAYAATEGNCYKARGKARHICMKLEEGKKYLADFKVMDHKVKTDIPNLKQQVELLTMTQDLLRAQRKMAEDALKKQEKVVTRMEKVSSKMNIENKDLLVSVEKYKKESEQLKRERWTFLLIGVGSGIVVTAVAITAIALYAKPI